MGMTWHGWCHIYTDKLSRWQFCYGKEENNGTNNFTFPHYVYKTIFLLVRVQHYFKKHHSMNADKNITEE